MAAGYMGDDHLFSVLDNMGIKVLHIDPDIRLQIKLHFSGAACKRFFESEEKEKSLNMATPITYQHFWGKHFVSAAFHDSQDKETELVQRLDVVQMKSKRDAESTSLALKQQQTLEARQDDVCTAICSAAALPANSPVHHAMDRAVQVAQLQLQLAHTAAAKAQEKLDEVWTVRIRKREEFDAQRAAKRKAAQEAVDKSRARKDAEHEVASGMGAQAHPAQHVLGGERVAQHLNKIAVRLHFR